MSPATFIDRSYRVTPDGGVVVCDTLATRADLDALRDALGWRRASLAVAELGDADAVLGLRALIGLDDRLLAAAATGDPGPLTLTREDTVALCELAGGFLATRDVTRYQPLRERDRLARLRTLSGRLMDAGAEFAAAEAEAHERSAIG